MEKTNSWTKLSRDDVMSFCDKYIDYLNASKTERLCVKNAEVMALEAGDVIDVTGYLYWYNGANTHITSVTVK